MKSIVLSISIFVASNLLAQPGQYEPSMENPHGLLNPVAPEEVGEYRELIGTSSCVSIGRNQDGTWKDTVSMVWTFKYIMDGTTVQDITVKDDGAHATSVRQYNVDSTAWYVTYFPRNNPPAVPSVWSGGLIDGKDIVLGRDHVAPNGTKGTSRLTFSDISEEGFNWEGVFVAEDKVSPILSGGSTVRKPTPDTDSPT